MNNNKNNLIREFVRALNQGNAALFAGAGLSIPSGGISWPNLLEDEAKAIGIDVYKEHDLTSVAQYIYNESARANEYTRFFAGYWPRQCGWPPPGIYPPRTGRPRK